MEQDAVTGIRFVLNLTLSPSPDIRLAGSNTRWQSFLPAPDQSTCRSNMHVVGRSEIPDEDIIGADDT